jgi:hypothetical protein
MQADRVQQAKAKLAASQSVFSKYGWKPLLSWASEVRRPLNGSTVSPVNLPASPPPRPNLEGRG